MIDWLLTWIDENLLSDRTFGATRSPKWPEVQKNFLALNPTCAACGANNKLLNPLNVHHKLPFHEAPQLELDTSNLITLCRRDHFLFGHLLSWSSWNEDVVVDARIIRDKISHRP